MTREFFSLGYSLSVKYDNGTPIHKLISFDTLSTAAGNEKTRLPATYVYNGTKGTFSGSNLVQVDIDTTIVTKEVLAKADQLNEKLGNSIYFLQESHSGKLHICVAIENQYNEEQYRHSARMAYAAVVRGIYLITGVNLFEEYDDKDRCVVDTRNTSPYQGLLFSNKPAKVYDDITCMEIDEETERKLCEFAGYKESVDERTFEKIDPFDGNVEFTNHHRVKVDRNYKVGGYSGNAVRCQYANVLWYYCKGDKKKFEAIKKTLFVNWNEFQPFGKKTPNLFFKAAFDKEFGVVLTELNEKHCGKPLKDGIEIKSGEYLCHYKDLIEKAIEKYRRIEIVSPTGTGKTFLMDKIAKERKAMIVTPFNSLRTNYSVNVVTPDGKSFRNGSSNVAVWDQAVKYVSRLGENDIIFVDEAHCLWNDRMWRKAAVQFVEAVNKSKAKLVLVTATDTVESTLFGVEKTLRFFKERKTVTATYMETANAYHTIKNLITDRKKNLIFTDRYAQLLYDNLKLEQRTNLCHAQRGKGLDMLLEKQELTTNVTICTRCVNSGINIRNNEAIRLVIQTDKYSDASTIIQAIGRLRNTDDIEVYIVYDCKDFNERTMDAETQSDILENGGKLGEIILGGTNPEERYRPSAEIAAQISEYFDRMDKETIIENLNKTGYIEVIDLGNIETPSYREENRLKRLASNQLISDITCTDIDCRTLIRYSEEDFFYLANWKGKLRQLNKRIPEKSIREYISVRSAGTNIMLDTIIRELFSLYNLHDLPENEREMILNAPDKYINEHKFDTSNARTTFSRTVKFLNGILNRVEVVFSKETREEEFLKDIFDASMAMVEENKIVIADKKSKGGRKGSPKVSITIRCIANDLPCDMEELNPDYTRTFASKGDCMRFLNIGSKQFSKFIKGEPCSISEVWKVVSVGGHDS